MTRVECRQYAITDRDSFDVIAIGPCISDCGSERRSAWGEYWPVTPLIQGDRLSWGRQLLCTVYEM